MSALDDARAQLEAGDFRAARELASGGLAEAPDDPELLRVAGRAGVELGADDAAGQLEQVAKLKPEDPEAWHDLGDAFATEGRMEDAAEAFRRAVELNPDDELALTHLGHSTYAAGKDEDAVSYLSQAAERTSSNMSTAVISLVEMYRELGQHEDALAAAQRIAEAEPDDVPAVLDVAELSVGLGRLDEAVAAYERIRGLEDLPDHEVLALHGMVLAELRRGSEDRALELAREAARIDEHGRTRDVLAFLGEPQEIAEGEEPPPVPTREEIEGALEASQVEHRRMHAEDRRLAGEDLVG